MSCLMAKIHNVNCAKKADMKSPAYFNPFTRRKKSVPQVPLRFYRKAFTGE